MIGHKRETWTWAADAEGTAGLGVSPQGPLLGTSPTLSASGSIHCLESPQSTCRRAAGLSWAPLLVTQRRWEVPG